MSAPKEREMIKEKAAYKINSASGKLIGNVYLETAEVIHGEHIDTINHVTNTITLKQSSPYS